MSAPVGWALFCGNTWCLAVLRGAGALLQSGAGQDERWCFGRALEFFQCLFVVVFVVKHRSCLLPSVSLEESKVPRVQLSSAGLHCGAWTLLLAAFAPVLVIKHLYGYVQVCALNEVSGATCNSRLLPAEGKGNRC